MAAGALYALEHHFDRLADDHAHAARLAAAIRDIDGLELRPAQVDTNIVIFRVDSRLGSAAEFCARSKERGLLMLALGPAQVRAVTHLDVTAADIVRACEILVDAARASRAATATRGLSYAG